jgi:hypothetical protein
MAIFMGESNEVASGVFENSVSEKSWQFCAGAGPAQTSAASPAAMKAMRGAVGLPLRAVAGISHVLFIKSGFARTIDHLLGGEKDSQPNLTRN